MKTHLKLLVFVYMFSVVILLALEFSQFNKVDNLRSEIGESHRLISGQDEGVRLELDFRRFADRLNSYVQKTKLDPTYGSEAASREELQVAFDVFWSRVFQMNSESVGLEGEQLQTLQPILVGLKRTLRQIEPMVQDRGACR